MTIIERIKTKPGYKLLLVAGMFLVVGHVDYHSRIEPEVKEINCAVCHSRKQSFTAYFERNGSKTPEQMAEAVLATKSPRLLAAIAKVESNGNATAKHKVSKAKGAFQVKERFWGKVSKDPVEQALQAEAILTELTETMPIKKALNVYGGDSKGRYAKTVLAELMEVPR